MTCDHRWVNASSSAGKLTWMVRPSTTCVRCGIDYIEPEVKRPATECRHIWISASTKPIAGSVMDTAVCIRCKVGRDET